MRYSLLRGPYPQSKRNPLIEDILFSKGWANVESNHKDSKIHFTKICMNRNIVQLIFMGIFALNCVPLFARQQPALVGLSAPSLAGAPAESANFRF